MPTTNLQVNLISFADTQQTNNPALRAHDYSIKLLGVNSSNPLSVDTLVAPGATESIFSGVRTTSIDGTTAFTISKPDPSKDLYRFSHVAGTAPVFRTERSVAVSPTSQIQVSVNGPIATYTSIGGAMMNTASVQVGDLLKVEKASNFNPVNRGRFVIIAKTSTSLTVKNTSAVAETVTLNAAANFLVYSNGSAGNQIQIGDKVVINTGFSPVTYGTYEIKEVTPAYFELSISSPNGIPIETGVIPGSTGMVFYSAAKKIIMIAALDRCAVLINEEVAENIKLEPSEVGNPERPALYIQNGTVYSLSIKNLSTSPLSLIVASVE